MFSILDLLVDALLSQSYVPSRIDNAQPRVTPRRSRQIPIPSSRGEMAAYVWRNRNVHYRKYNAERIFTNYPPPREPFFNRHAIQTDQGSWTALKKTQVREKNFTPACLAAFSPPFFSPTRRRPRVSHFSQSLHSLHFFPTSPVCKRIYLQRRIKFEAFGGSAPAVNIAGHCGRKNIK